MADDESHLLWRALRSRDEQIALVLAVVVVGDDHDASGGKGREHSLHALGVVDKSAAGRIGKKYGLAVVAQGFFVGFLLASQRRRCKTRPDLDPLDGIDAHQGRGEIAVEFAVNGRAETNGYAFRNDLDDGANRGATLADIVEIAFEELRLLRIRTEERI